MHDSFQVITPNNIDILEDEVFTKTVLIDDIDRYLSKDPATAKMKSLPFARSLTGDKFGFLFFVYEEGKSESSMIFNCGTERAYYDTVPIGQFPNYFTEFGKGNHCYFLSSSFPKKQDYFLFE